MTREEAIRELKIQFVGEYDRQREAKDLAIEALNQEPITVETINQYCKEHNYVLCEKGTEPKVNVVSEEVYTREYNLRKDAEMKVYKLKRAIDDIKAEIIKMRSEHNCSCSDCLDIIDKYMKEGDA